MMFVRNQKRLLSIQRIGGSPSVKTKLKTIHIKPIKIGNPQMR